MRGPDSTPPPSSRTRGRASGGTARTLKAALPRVPGGKALARRLFFEQQRAEQVGETPAEVVARSRKVSPRSLSTAPRRERGAVGSSPFIAAVEALAAQPLATAMPVQQAWRPLGPASIPHGQTYGEGIGSRPSVSGRVSSLAIDPGDPRHILLGAAGGGVWESRDDGGTWAPRTDNQPSLSIGVVTFDPTNPSIAYAGTGEGISAFSDGTHLLGVGLLRSVDGGTSWTLHARAPFERTGFYDLAVDPLDGDHLLAATTVGLFQSTDGGVHWTRRRSQLTWNVSFGPQLGGNTAREIFAACSDGLFRSTNGGSTWTSVPLPGGTNLVRLEVCHAPSDANIVYAFGATNAGLVWRRSVLGGTFSTVPLPPDLEVGQAWYDWFAAVAPNNPNVLYVGAINVHKGLRSASGQWSWTNISARTTGDSIHPDQHAIAFSPLDPNMVYIGNDGGIFRSPDGGLTWKTLNKGLSICEVEFLAQHPQFEAWLLAGTQDNGTLRYQGDSVWFHVGDGDGGDCGVDLGSPYNCYHTYFGMGVAKSTKGGDWSSFTGPPDFVIGPKVLPEENYRDKDPGALFYPPVEVNGRVIAQAGNKVFISSNAGTDWTRVDLNLTGGELSSALAIPSATRVFAGTNVGNIFRIDFRQGAWQPPIALTSPAAGFISDLLVDPTNANRMYAAFSSLPGGGGVFRSDNAGSSWTRLGTGLPPRLPINAIEIDPANPDTIFCAADLGVYISHNAGGAWAPFNNGLPNALVKDLLFHPVARLLRAGTQSRGVWEIAVDAATVPDVEIYLRDSSVDTGRLSPSPSGVSDPFLFGAQTFWWQCKDIKVDSPSFHRPAPGDVDFEVFSDDQSLFDQGIEFAAGLSNENPQRNRTVRVYVQVHNRGVNPALNLTVKVFFAAAGTTFPDLPAGFWTNYPNNILPANSPWQAIASHQTVSSVAGGRTEIVAFEWRVPATAPNQVALLALISADNDSLVTTETSVATLVTTQKKCGLKNITVVNPASQAGPPVMAVPLQVRAAGPLSPGTLALEIDRGGAAMLRGIVLGKRFAKAAKKAKWKEVKLTAEDKVELARVIADNPQLKKDLHLTSAFAAKKGPLVDSFELPEGESEPLVLLVRPDPGPRYGSLIQTDGQGNLMGGITLAAR